MLNLSKTQKNSIIEYLANRKILSELYDLPKTEKTQNLINELESAQYKKLDCIDDELATEIIIYGDDIIKHIK